MYVSLIKRKGKIEHLLVLGCDTVALALVHFLYFIYNIRSGHKYAIRAKGIGLGLAFS
jgi:hypothetical protein